MKNSAPHEGHRARMRTRFREAGLVGFHPHEILEMLLFYAIPRKDTNEIAHKLLDEFGSLEHVFAASPEALRRVPGMTENAAMMLSFLRAVYLSFEAEPQTAVLLDSGQQAGEYFLRLYRFERHEIVRLAILDDNLILKQCIRLAEGHPSAAALSARQVEEAAAAGAGSLLILAHNHPNGSAKPSDVDISTTRILAAALKEHGIALMDHIIIGGGEYCSLRECGAFLGIS